ncbi:MAG: MotA/TolQ/ExbB proton channel family protein [Pseudomonadota bacterium]
MMRTVLTALLVGLMGWTVTHSTYAQSTAATQIKREVSQSRQRLAQTEQRIASANASLNQRIRRAEQSVLELRRSAAEIQRSSDNETLSIEVIEGRLQRWKEQERFQRSVVIEYARTVRQDDLSNTPYTELLSELNTMVRDLGGRLRPQFQPDTVILPSGLATQGQSVQLGPVRWFVYESGGGVVSSSQVGQEPTLTWAFSGGDLDNLRDLASEGTGALTLDPTLGRYMELQAAQQTVFEHVSAGGIWVIPILLFALISLSIAAHKTLQFMRLPTLDTALHRKLQKTLTSDSGQDNSDIPAFVRPLVNVLQQSISDNQREDQIFDYLLQQRARLNRRIGAIAVTATVSPLLGLLGTVSGMISTFRAMTVFGSGDPSVVSGGISEALVTTELGLVVAVPSLIAHALLKRKADAYAAQLETMAVHLDERRLPSNA